MCITGVFKTIIDNNGSNYIATVGNASANWSATTLADLRKLPAAISEYADRPGECKFYMNRAFYQSVVTADLDALNGNSFWDISAAPGPNPTLFGYPVVYTQVMSSDSTPAVNTVLAAFGNFKTGAIMGSRRDLRIQVSDQVGFISDSLFFRATERFGFKFHDQGSAAVLVANGA